MMMSDSHRSMLRRHGTLLGRVLMGLLFLFSGIGMLMQGVDNVAGMVESKGLPFPLILAWLVVAVKILAGGVLMLGYRVGCASALLIGFTFLTIVFFHPDYKNDPSFFKNLAIIGGLLYVMAYGPGEGWSLGKGRTAAPAPENTTPEGT